ncbi:efflux RND transporter periplasmic adaptor subunit [Actinoplanes regularis]|uniref:efflux RND transporter periplasmic adaptor subunit n=1 Tax=Actinoplanes regularis TaxID=52697 RepID=UPI0024A377BA|nr:efflux RND transporter periplasmic adaptor subunit [Actinoplanes regularis]GLW31897.1 secretion protein HlyD [Actinoplanes regularis]
MSKITGQNRSRRIRWTGAGIIAAGVAAGVVLGVVHHRQGGPKMAEVVAVAVEKGAVTLDVATTGTVEPATVRELSFAVTGTVESIAARAGTKVRAGQILATVDNTGAAGDVDDAEISLSDAAARLSTAQGQAAAVTARATVCATPPQGHLAGVASAAVPTSVAASAAATTCTTPGYPDTGDPILSAQQAVNRARQAVAQAVAALAGTVIVAPIAGTVVSVAGGVGDTVAKGRTFVTLAGTSGMQVVANFPEADAGSLKVGRSGTITLADHDDPLAGTVVQVDPVGTSDGTLVRYGVLLSFAAAPQDLLIGQSAEVRVRVGESRDVLRVPSTAVHDISGSSGTVLVHDGKRSSERAVTVGLRGDQYTEVTGGLTTGEQVVRSW